MRWSRREFIFLGLIVGLTGMGSASVTRFLKKRQLPLGDYKGPLADRVRSYLDRMDRGEISPEYMTTEMHKIFSEFDLNEEFASWIYDLTEKNPRRDIELFHFQDSKRYDSMNIVVRRPGYSSPPHGHNDLASYQTLLTGRMELRQYDRIKRVGENQVLLRPLREVILYPRQPFLTTEMAENIHWFGAIEKPALLFDYQWTGLPSRFDVRRNKTPDTLDPTGPCNEDGLILATYLERSVAKEKFNKVLPSAFTFVAGESGKNS